jgi:hypothetical protein
MLLAASVSALPRLQWLPNLGGLGTARVFAAGWL